MARYPENGIKYLKKNIKGRITVESPASFAAIVKGDCKLGYLSYIGRNSEIVNTEIGRFCSIATDFVSGPTDHPTDRLSSHLFAFANNGPFRGSPEFAEWLRDAPLPNDNKRVVIGHDVWIGRNVTIRRGVTIGDGAIIGAGSVVTRNVAPYTIVGGAPAKLIRNRFSPAITHHLLTLQWHQFDLRRQHAPKLDVTDIERSVRYLRALKAKGELQPLVCDRYLIEPHDVVTQLS